MTDQDQETMRTVVEAMIEELGEEGFQTLQDQTYCFRILTSVYYCASTDPVVITKDIVRSFNSMIPIEQVATIVNNYLPSIINDKFVMVNGVLTKEAIDIAQRHNDFLRLGYTKKVLH